MSFEKISLSKIAINIHVQKFIFHTQNIDEVNAIDKL